MDESEENISADDIQGVDSPLSVKIKPKKRSLVERELETNLTARVTSPVSSEGTSTSRYGRARRLKTGLDIDMEKIMKPLKIDVSKTQPQAYKMHASNSPIRKESPKRAISVVSSIEDQIENIYNENISLSRFGSEEKAKSQSPAKKFGKVYMRKDLIQKSDNDTVVLIKNMFSPTKPNSHLNNILERSSEKYSLNGHGKAWNGYPETSSVVKTLDFDGKKKKKDVKEKVASKNELFELEAACEYQVGDLAWARVGTYPFWPCIVTREPFSEMFVKKKLFGRVEHAVFHVTFFGDNGRRGWIVDNMLRQYSGKAEFEATREKFTPEAKKKDPRLYAAHFVSEKKLPLWNVSVEEAETLMKVPKRLRIDILYDMLEKSRAAKTTPKREKGGKITRTDSDVSLSESLYDTLFSEDDGKADDNSRTKNVRKKSLDVSEVVTACLDNMAAKSGIIKIQKQSHMDRWLQKAKSKTPEKIQPKLQIKVKTEKRKDRMKKNSKEGKKSHKLRKNESLSSDTNLSPYQNEHDYSSVNYENHDINDSSNKNTDSASGHDSTLDSCGIDVVVKVESLSGSMDDCSQDDIITTVVNDDFVMTEPENVGKDVTGNQDKIPNDTVNNKVENNNVQHHSENNTLNENEQIEIKLEVQKSDLNNGVQPRRSKRKRQTFEGLNSSTTENKVKEPKLDLAENRTSIDAAPVDLSKNNDMTRENNNTLEVEKNPESIEKVTECNEPTEIEDKIEELDIETSLQKILKSKFTSFNSKCKPVVVIEPLKMDTLETQIFFKEVKLVQNKSLDSEIKIINNTEDNLQITSVTSTEVNDENDSSSNCTKTLQENSIVDTKVDDSDISTTPVGVEAKEDQGDVVKDNHEIVPEKSVDSEIMEVENEEEEKLTNLNVQTIIPETTPGTVVLLETAIENKSAEVLKLPQVAENMGDFKNNSATNVIIGEETYIFDRTLSQDYDEIDSDRCGEINSLAEVGSITEGEVSIGANNNSCPHEQSLSLDSHTVREATDDMETTETTKRLADDDSLESINKSSNGTKIAECLLATASKLQKEVSDEDNCNISYEVTKVRINLEAPSDKDYKTKAIIEISEKDRLSSAINDASNTINGEQSKEYNEKTEENNTKSVFLDQALETGNAQSNDNTERKRKSPRLSLKRTKHHTPLSNKKVNDSQNLTTESLDNGNKILNSDPVRSDVETASVDSDDSEVSLVRRKGRAKDKANMDNPEFVKYLEIRQDALIDEHPDLTQDEVVTYLYQNWLYEEGNKSDTKKSDDTEQSNIVKGLNQEPVLQAKKIKKKSKVRKEQESKNLDIRDMMQKEKSKENQYYLEYRSEYLESGIHDTNHHKEIQDENLDDNHPHKSEDNAETLDVNKLNDIDRSMTLGKCETPTKETNSNTESNITVYEPVSGENSEKHSDSKSDSISKDMKMLSDAAHLKTYEKIISSTKESSNLQIHNALDHETNDIREEPINDTENKEKPNDNEVIEESENFDLLKRSDKNPKESAPSKINGLVEHKETFAESRTNDEFDPETASLKSEESGVSLTKRRGRPKEKQDVRKAMDDPEFIKYLEARQDALIDEQPDLTHDEIVTYLYQTWFYEESNKSDMKKTDDTVQSNLVKGLNQEPAPQPRKYKKKPKVDKDPDLNNVDIRDMMQKDKPKRKATQSKPYYNEDDSDLEEEDLETFKIFEKDEQTEAGEEIDEVELYFEQLAKPKPNVFKGYVRERVCEICDRTGNLVKCKSCHGTFHVDCVKKEADVIEITAPTRGRKKKRGRKPKGYDPLLDSGSQSDERSQDANNSEEFNMSIEDEPETHIVLDEENFETQWELKMKELQSENQDYASDQEINWEIEPGQCEIVDIKQKEKPIDYSDYKCNKCTKYETPICFVCKCNKSPKSHTEVRQKCQVAHCHRYYHLECLDHWPQTQFNSWEPSKTNKKVIEYIEALSCPRHVCHTCVSDDPRGCKTRFSGDKLARCVKCPATYHSYTKCLPAGTQILTGSQIICPRHYDNRPGKVPCHVNTGWCFICALGGTLICCEYCPTSFHAECLNIKPPEGSYMCEDCETGRLPLYGEMVWVKLGHYRWWPGIVLHPTEIPDNILSVKHSQGEFVVRFFGQYDHYWVNRGRVFPFQEGDSGRISSQKSKIDAAFTTAMEHAQRACEILKKMEPNAEEDMDIASSLLPPHYVKLKANKPAGNVARRDIDANSLTQCDCDPTQPDPCGPYSHCLNRMLLTECGPLCRAGDGCNNRAFERRLYPRLAAYRTHMRGWGLRALEDIKQGQFVIEYVGELIDMEEFRRRMCRKHEIRDENFYFLTLDKERMIDAGPKGNLARFMNHCCEPNCETQKWTVLGDVRVGLFALRDIPANSEVTFNYNLECAGIEKKRCLCGAKRCSGYIGAKPKQLQDDQPKKVKPPAKRTYKKRKPVEDSPSTSKKVPKIKIKPIKPRELTEIEKDLLIIKNATNGMSSDSEGSRLSSVDEKNPKALKRKRVSFSTDEVLSSGKKPRLEDGEPLVE